MPGDCQNSVLFHIFVGVEPEPFELGEHLVYASGKFILTRIFKKKYTSVTHYLLFLSKLSSASLLRTIFASFSARK